MSDDGMTESKLAETAMMISSTLGADTEIYWDDMHVTSWEEPPGGSKALSILGIVLALLFFYFAIAGVG